jgi:mannose-1-phosphate guanylyltransferase
MKCVILAAGLGSRLWPLSTPERPKQFQQLIGNQTPLQYTHGLLCQALSAKAVYVLTLSGLETLVHEQLPDMPQHNLIAVPERRNTLPHTLFALNQLADTDTEPLLFMPADMYYARPNDLLRAVRGLEQVTTTTRTHLLCAPASSIDRTLGYVLVDEAGAVAAFVEKPDAHTAKRLASSTGTYVNTMGYLTSAAAIRSQLGTLAAETGQLAAALLSAQSSQRTHTFLDMPFIDISHGLFEQADNLTALPIATPIIDIGKFSSLYAINKKDRHNNVTAGPVLFDGLSHGNFVVNRFDRPLAIINTQDSVVIQTPDGSLVAPLSHVDTIGDMYKQQINTNWSR